MIYLYNIFVTYFNKKVNNLKGTTFNLIIALTEQSPAKWFFNKEDSASVPYDQRKGVDASANKTTTITVKWTPGSNQRDCDV